MHTDTTQSRQRAFWQAAAASKKQPRDTQKLSKPGVVRITPLKRMREDPRSSGYERGSNVPSEYDSADCIRWFVARDVHEALSELARGGE